MILFNPALQQSIFRQAPPAFIGPAEADEISRLVSHTNVGLTAT
jgi:hypothetical protein